jgi:hypothetical protein
MRSDGGDVAATLREIEGERCLIVDHGGPVVRDAEGARRLVEEALSNRATLIAVPVGRLGPAFFQLRSGLAGEMLQKAANYGLKFAVVGDVSGHVAGSSALRDLVVESGRGRSLFFVADLPALAERLAALRAPHR